MIDDGDAEAVALHKKKTTLQNQREGEAQFTARLQPKVYTSWCVSYTDLDMIDPDTKQQGHTISLIENPQGYLLSNKLVYGRPTLEDILTALHVGMAYPCEGKGRRPAEILVAWRLRDMHGTDFEGRNNPDPEDWDREPGDILKEEGNDWT
ncbi:g5021 [Coccomyxa elongata]